MTQDERRMKLQLESFKQEAAQGDLGRLPLLTTSQSWEPTIVAGTSPVTNYSYASLSTNIHP